MAVRNRCRAQLLWGVFSVIGVCLLGANMAVAATSNIYTKVRVSNDDAEEHPAGWVALKSPELELVNNNVDQQVGLRFRNIYIPAGAIVVEAYVQFTAAAPGSAPAALSFRGELSSNAKVFREDLHNISSRQTTTSQVEWSPAPWLTTDESGPAQRTPNLAPIVNEITTGTGWTGGNSLVFVVAGNGQRIARSFNGGAAQAPRLIIKYEDNVNTPPAIWIAAPKTETEILEGDGLTFYAYATDTEDGPIHESVNWHSSIDGELGAGSAVYTLLSAGEHLITASVTDSGGETTSQPLSITVTPVVPPNTPPTVTIETPEDGVVIETGEMLSLNASAIDNEDGDITAAVVWASSIDSTLPVSGGTADVSLSEGTHIITAIAVDSGYLDDTDAITVTVEAPRVIPESMDVQLTSGDQDAEESAGGDVSFSSSDLELVFDNDNQTVGLHFADLEIYPGSVITSAWVQFTVDETSAGAANLAISGDASGNSAALGGGANNLSQRSRTASVVNWTPADWPVVGAAGTDQRTPDLAGIVNEVIGQPNWAAGNAVTLLIEGSGKRVAESANGAAGAAPILHLEYVFNGNKPPVVDAGTSAYLQLPANSLTLNGSAGDDGKPDGTLNTGWIRVGGTGGGNVVFGDSSAPNTTVTIDPQVGSYVLRLTADDGEHIVFDDVTIVIGDGGVVTSISQSNYFDTGFANSTSPLAIPATDPAGLVYHPPTGRLILADSEINEISSAFSIVGANLFEIPLSGGTVFNQWDTTQSTGNEPSQNREPTGIAYCENDDHFYISNDDSRYIYRYEFDGSEFTAVDAFNTQGYQSDPEGLTCDPTTGRIYVIGGIEVSIMVLSYDGGFVLEEILDLPQTAGNNAGVPVDAEGITFDPGSGNLFVISSQDERIYEYRLDGSWVKSFDIRDFNPKTINAQGLSIGPASDNPQQTSFYISDGMVDNDSNANERDGRIYEARINRQ